MSSEMEFVNYYARIGVESTASSEAIANKIRALVKQWHPDVCKDARAHEMTVCILEAKEVLLNSQLRAQYDVLWKQRLRAEASGDKAAEEQVDEAWRYQSYRVKYEAEQEASLSLEQVLGLLVELLLARRFSRSVPPPWEPSTLGKGLTVTTSVAQVHHLDNSCGAASEDGLALFAS